MQLEMDNKLFHCSMFQPNQSLLLKVSISHLLEEEIDLENLKLKHNLILCK
jgi:hypothetical protein